MSNLLNRVILTSLLLVLSVFLKAQCSESNDTNGFPGPRSFIAQSFQASCDGNISTITVDIGAISGDDNAITSANIYIATGNNPLGVVVGSQLTGVTLTASSSNSFDFSSANVTVSSGATYTLVVDDNADADAFEVQIDAADPYSDGSYWSDASTNITGSDVDFSVAVNDAPTITLPATQIIQSATTLTFNAGKLITLADGDDDNQSVTITVSNSGTLSLNIAEIGDLTSLTGNGSGSLSFGGTITDINEALSGAVYDPNGDVGAQTITISTDDGNGGSDGPDVLNITVNQAPVLTVPGAQNVNNNATLTFTTGNLITVADPDGDNQSITISVSNGGTLTLNASETGDLTSLSGNGSASLSFGGTITDINQALDGAVYDPDGSVGAQTLSISTSDGKAGSDGPEVINITVNQVPVINLPSAQTIQAAGTLTFTTGNLISLSDGDGDDQTVAITVSNGGTLTLNAAETGDLTNLTGDGTDNLSFEGTLTDINQALDGAVYDPNGTVGSQSISVSTDDGNGGTVGPGLLGIKVNQSPTLTVPTAQTIASNGTFSFTTGNLITVADLDGDDQTLTISVSNTGTLTLNASEVGDLSTLFGDGSNSLSLSGTITNINQALDGAVYDPNGTVGAQTVSITTNDGSGGSDGPDLVNFSVAPYIVAAYFYDDGANGIDEMVIELSEDIDESSVQKSDFNLTGATLGAFSSFASGNIDNPLDIGSTDEFITFEIVNLTNVTTVGGLSASYTASGSNDIASNTTGLSAATLSNITEVDRAGPLMISGVLQSGNTGVVLTFSEGVWANGGTNPIANTAVDVANFENDGAGGVGGLGATGVTRIDLVETTQGNALSGGETSILVEISVSPDAVSANNSDGNDQFDLIPLNGASVYDVEGNAMVSSEVFEDIVLEEIDASNVPAFQLTDPYLPNSDNTRLRLQFTQVVDGKGDGSERLEWKDDDKKDLFSDEIVDNNGANTITAFSISNQDLSTVPSGASATLSDTWYLTMSTTGSPRGYETLDLEVNKNKIKKSALPGIGVAMEETAFTITFADQYQDAFDDAGDAVVSAAFAEAFDHDFDGNIDSITVSLTDNIIDASLAAAIAANDFEYGSGSGIQPTGFHTGTTANDNLFALLFDNSNGLGTTVTADLVFTQGNLTDDAGSSSYDGSNFLITSGSLTPVDQAGPVMISAETYDTGISPNGKIDELVITFSEPIADVSMGLGSFSLDGGGYTYNAFTLNDPTTSDITLTLDEIAGAGVYDTDVTFDIEATGGSISDGVTPNPAQTGPNAVTSVDNAAPFVSLNTVTDTDQTPDLSGNVDDPNATVLITIDGNTRSAVNDGVGGWTLTNSADPFTLTTIGGYDVTTLGIDLLGNNFARVVNDGYTLDGGAIITPANPGTICVSDGFVSLGQIRLLETANGDFASTGSILLTLPEGFEFDPSITADFSASLTSDITLLSATYIGTASIRLDITLSGMTGIDDVRIDGLEIKAIQDGASGNLLRAGGDATLLTEDTNYASLSSGSSPATPSSVQDQDGNTLTQYVANVLAIVDVVYETPTAPPYTIGETVEFTDGESEATGVVISDNGVNAMQIYLIDGDLNDVDSTATGETSGNVANVTSATLNTEVVPPFSLTVTTGGNTPTWVNAATELTINNNATNSNVNLSAVAPGLYSYDVSLNGGDCESEPLRVNALVYSDLNERNGRTFIDKTYVESDSRDSIYLSNPTNHLVSVNGAGITVTNPEDTELLVLFDPGIAGSDNSPHTITYQVTNETTGESVTLTADFTVTPVTEFFNPVPDENTCFDELPLNLTLDVTQYGPNTSTDFQFIQILFYEYMTGGNFGYFLSSLQIWEVLIPGLEILKFLLLPLTSPWWLNRLVKQVPSLWRGSVKIPIPVRLFSTTIICFSTEIPWFRFRMFQKTIVKTKGSLH